MQFAQQLNQVLQQIKSYQNKVKRFENFTSLLSLDILKIEVIYKGKISKNYIDVVREHLGWNDFDFQRIAIKII